MRDDMEEGATTGETVAPDARWMTYGELAAFLGIEEGSARRRVQREKWERRPGNDGKARIAVPSDVQPGEAPAKGADAGEDTNRLAEHLARERERAEAAERDREAARAQAATAEAEGQGLREELGQAQAQAADAEEALRLWREGGPLARAWRAFINR